MVLAGAARPHQLLFSPWSVNLEEGSTPEFPAPRHSSSPTQGDIYLAHMEVNRPSSLCTVCSV